MARIVASIAVRTFAAVQLKAGYCCGWEMKNPRA
jgi:hypothetical protein